MASIQLTRYEAEEGDLPDVCMCCGEPAMERKRLRFTAYPLRDVLLLMWDIFNPLWLVVRSLWDWRSRFTIVVRKTRYIHCYIIFCPRHKNYWFVRSLNVWVSLVVILVLVFGGFVLAAWLSGQVSRSTEDLLFGSMCIASPVLLLGWLISIPLSQVTAIHPANATAHELTLKRVSHAFVEAVHQYRAEHKGRTLPKDYREHFQPRRSLPRHREGDDDRIERS